ncbi:MAG: hypothetical protein ACC657_05460 [Thiohalomonadales bacterium]
MKNERKSKATRREKKQRKSRLSKRAKKKAKIKYRVNIDDEEIIDIASKSDFVVENKNERDQLITIGSFNEFFNKVKSNKSFLTKMVLASSLFIAIIVVSLNISPILKYALQDQDSALYPILKKYADDLRTISSRLTVVTRRLNMLSLVSEENELTNTTRINSLVLQINEMWFTTKKYLNFIGIETIAHTELEKEIDANSKINEKGLIRETKAEEIIPKDEITLSKVLKLDSIIQDLNFQIDSVNNEITFLEDNVYSSIKASHIYSHLLERSRNANGNYYADSSIKSENSNIKIKNKQNIATSKNVSTSNNIDEKTISPSNIKTTPKNKQIEVSKTIINQPVKVAKKKQKITKIEEPKMTQQALAQQELEKLDKQEQEQEQEPAEVAVAKVKIPIKKIVGEFTIKDSPVSKTRKDQTNNLTQTKNNLSGDSVKDEESFENTSLLDDVDLDYISNYNEDNDTEVSGTKSVDEDTDYTGG